MVAEGKPGRRDFISDEEPDQQKSQKKPKCLGNEGEPPAPGKERRETETDGDIQKQREGPDVGGDPKAGRKGEKHGKKSQRQDGPVKQRRQGQNASAEKP